MSPKKKVLVVEDDPHIRTFLVRRLESSGYETLCAEDGAEGLEKSRQEHPDVILLDLKLPKLSGEEVCKQVREDRDKTFARTPIIMLTGKTADVDRVIGRVLGADSYVTKPFRTQELLQQIEKFAREGPNAKNP